MTTTVTPCFRSTRFGAEPMTTTIIERMFTMKKQYKETRIISSMSLRQLCINMNWYTLGDNEEYEHLLYDLAAQKPNLTTEDIMAIAEDIMEHSEMSPDYTIESVAFEVGRIANTFFEEV